jgi:hypothetical protein
MVFNQKLMLKLINFHSFTTDFIRRYIYFSPQELLGEDTDKH